MWDAHFPAQHMRVDRLRIPCELHYSSSTMPSDPYCSRITHGSFLVAMSVMVALFAVVLTLPHTRASCVCLNCGRTCMWLSQRLPCRMRWCQRRSTSGVSSRTACRHHSHAVGHCADMFISAATAADVQAVTDPQCQDKRPCCAMLHSQLCTGAGEGSTPVVLVMQPLCVSPTVYRSPAHRL